jgi:hypothetical protein
MLNEIAGHLWWAPLEGVLYEVYLQAGHSVYRCSPHEDAWRKVNATLDPKRCEFTEPLGMVISKCLSSADGCHYILFDDEERAIRVFNPPPSPGMVRILAHAASMVSTEEVKRLLNSDHRIWETPIIQE